MTCSPNQTSCLPSQTHDLQIMRSQRISLKCVVCSQKSLTKVVCWWRGVPPWYFEVKIFQYCRSISLPGEDCWQSWSRNVDCGLTRTCTMSSLKPSRGLMSSMEPPPLSWLSSNTIGRRWRPASHWSAGSDVRPGLRSPVLGQPGAGVGLVLPAAAAACWSQESSYIAISFAQLKDGLSHPATTWEQYQALALTSDWEWTFELSRPRH